MTAYCNTFIYIYIHMKGEIDWKAYQRNIDPKLLKLDW